MATKSFLKNITIQDRRSAVRFVTALEKAKKHAAPAPEQTRAYSDATAEDIRWIMGKKK